MSLTKEDLLALSQMMDEKLDKKLDEKLDKNLKPIHEDISSIHEDISSMKEEIASIDDRIDEKLKPIQEEIRHTRVLLENQEHNIRLIAEQYTDISLKLGRVNEIDDLRDRVRTLETIAKNHSAKLQELQKAE